MTNLKWLHPKCVGYDGRVCFSIVFFATEKDAMAYDKVVRKEGRAYNGGFFHGMPCGRDPSFDRIVDGKKQWAVTR